MHCSPSKLEEATMIAEKALPPNCDRTVPPGSQPAMASSRNSDDYYAPFSNILILRIFLVPIILAIAIIATSQTIVLYP